MTISTDELRRELARTLERHGAPDHVVEATRLMPPENIDQDFKEKLYRGLERAGADRFLLGTVGSWGEGSMTDAEVLAVLRDLNAGTFEFETEASTSVKSWA